MVATISFLICLLVASPASGFTGISLRSPFRRAAVSGSSISMVADDAKVCLVTGASRGLGRSIALELGKSGCKVVVNYAASEGPALQVVEEIKKAGGDAVAIKANCK